MQVIIIISILLIVGTVIIYKINDKFEKKREFYFTWYYFLATIGFILRK